jgi:multiple sugar transport system substrate-binding protein
MMRREWLRGVLILWILALGAGVASSGPRVTVNFLSTQLNPIQEAEWVRRELLPPLEQEAGISVRFLPEESGAFVDRLIAEQRARRVTIDLAGTLHGDFPILVASGVLEDLTALQNNLSARKDRTFIPEFLRLSRMGGIQAYIPWMQATYLLAVNKKALPYLPAGANVNALTYEQLRQWGENITAATKERKLGFPAGPRGLFGRFLHGYLYPSFTGTQVQNFRSPEAVEMWRFLKRLWLYVNPSSLRYEFMHEPLLSEEVWIAWDHTARLIPAIRARPNDFIVVPSPRGPKGLGFITVIAGLSIPKGAPNAEAAATVIEYLTRPQTQIKVLQGVAFFPTVREASGMLPVGPERVLATGVTAQATARGGKTALLPIGLGARVGEFVPAYLDAFRAIMIQGQPIEQVLDRQARVLNDLYRATNAPCTPPDPPQQPCQVK